MWIAVIILTCSVAYIAYAARENAVSRRLYNEIDKEYALIRDEKLEAYSEALDEFKLNGEPFPLEDRGGLPYSSYYPRAFSVYSHNGSEVYHQHIDCKTLKHTPNQRHLFECFSRKRPCRICSNAPPPEIYALYEAYAEAKQYQTSTATERYARTYCADKGLVWASRSVKTITATVVASLICSAYLAVNLLPTIQNEPQSTQSNISSAYSSSQQGGGSSYTPRESVPETPTYYDDTQSYYVYVSRTGECYHSNPNCSNMKSPLYMTIDEAEARGRRPCSKCY